jgi:hypothetical protein
MFFFFSETPPVFPRRGLYARVSRVDSLSTSLRRRASFEFDCIDADYVDGAGAQLLEGFGDEQTKPFALLRVVTTPTDLPSSRAQHRYRAIVFMRRGIGVQDLNADWFCGLPPKAVQTFGPFQPTGHHGPLRTPVQIG